VSSTHCGHPEKGNSDRLPGLAVIIPARYESSRFPGKPLHRLAGKPMIQHVWERASRARMPGRVLIATDDNRIADVARDFGARVVMTRANHPSGSDRIAEVASGLPEITHLLNVQGDEPLIAPELIDRLAMALIAPGAPPMVTAATPRYGSEGIADANIVKVVCSLAGEALYFSRSPLPYHRDKREGLPSSWLQHRGIYGYTRELLLQFVAWQPALLEQSESLEQLRALEHGVRIGVIHTQDNSPGVDTPEQAFEVEKILLSQI